MGAPALGHGLEVVLVQSTADEDPDVVQPRPVQDRPALSCQVRQVAAVDPDGQPARPALLAAELVDEGDGPTHALERVVGVDQQGGAIGEVLDKGPERFDLGREGLHVGVGHRAGRAEPVAAGRLDVARGGEAGDGGRARHASPGVGALRAAQRKVDERHVARREPAPQRLGGDRRLEGDLVEQVGLDQLGLGERSGDLEEGLFGEDHPALGHGVDVAGEAQRGEPLDVLGAEAVRSEPGQVLGARRPGSRDSRGNPRARLRRESRGSVAGPSRRG